MDAFTQGMLLQVSCDLMALVAETEGMKSHNKNMEWGKAPMRYNEEDFFKKADEMRSLGNFARELGQRGS